MSPAAPPQPAARGPRLPPHGCTSGALQGRPVPPARGFRPLSPGRSSEPGASLDVAAQVGRGSTRRPSRATTPRTGYDGSSQLSAPPGPGGPRGAGGPGCWFLSSPRPCRPRRGSSRVPPASPFAPAHALGPGGEDVAAASPRQDWAPREAPGLFTRRVPAHQELLGQNLGVASGQFWPEKLLWRKRRAAPASPGGRFSGLSSFLGAPLPEFLCRSPKPPGDGVG